VRSEKQQKGMRKRRSYKNESTRRRVKLKSGTKIPERWIKKQKTDVASEEEKSKKKRQKGRVAYEKESGARSGKLWHPLLKPRKSSKGKGKCALAQTGGEKRKGWSPPWRLERAHRGNF